MTRLLPILFLLLPGLTLAETLWDEMQACKPLPDDERLACFDSLVADDRQIPAEIAATPEGGSKEQQQEFGREHKTTPELARLDTTVEEVLTDALGKLVVILDNGQIWRLVENKRGVRFDPGQHVTITRGIFNSFFLEADDGSRKLRVKRIR